MSWVIYAFVLVLGCASDADTAVEPEITWNSDIKPLFDTNCVECHKQGSIGGFSLETYEDAYAVRTMVQSSVEDRSMPPWGASDDCNEYAYDLSLDDEEIDLVSAWVEMGAPEGAESPQSGTQRERRTLSRTDFTIEMPEPFTPSMSPDDYRCFVIEWPLEEEKYVTGYRINPGNEALVHHVIAYIGDPDNADAYDEMDPDGEGYTCFGGPGVVSDDDARWLGGWAPGGESGDFPQGTGIKVEPGSRIIMQVHYNTLDAEMDSDNTTVDVMIDDEVERPATIQPWADPNWLTGDSMLIEAGESGVEHSFSFVLPTDVMIYTSALHMHKLGADARLKIDRADGSETCLLDIPEWDFNWQRTFLFEEPVLLESGDALTLECHWDNTTDEDVVWGDGTSDEMCLGTMYMSFP